MLTEGQYFPKLRNSEDCDWAKGGKQKDKGEIRHYRLRKSGKCQAQWSISPQLIPVFVAISSQGYFYSPVDGTLVHRMATLCIRFGNTHFIHLGEEALLELSTSPKTQWHPPRL